MVTIDAESLAWKSLQNLLSVKYIPNGYDVHAVRGYAHLHNVKDENVILEAISIVQRDLPKIWNAYKTVNVFIEE